LATPRLETEDCLSFETKETRAGASQISGADTSAALKGNRIPLPHHVGQTPMAKGYGTLPKYHVRPRVGVGVTRKNNLKEIRRCSEKSA